MDSYSDKTTPVISLCKFQKDKKYKKKIVKEIIGDICAMLNSNGGRVVISVEDSSPQTSGVIRVLEQFIISAIGLNQTVSKINFTEGDAGSIIVSVGKADSLITTNYNLYLPSQTQVVAVPSLEPLGEIKDNIINRKVVFEPVQRGTHCKKFMKHKIYTSVHESKTCQLKNLKAGASKRTTLADRMTGKGNKFSCYVSAFANHRGGHIYYGIRDDGVVEGEFIPNEKNKEEIRKKVENAINKMIWPEQIGKPKRGEHWEIFFEPVVDENSKPVPSTFVVVIYIAPCLGGVFTEVPECYEMVDGIAQMLFVTWKKRISPPVFLRKSQRERKIPNSDERRKWSSDAVRKAFTTDCDKLRKIVSNGNWEILEKECNALQNNSGCRETMQLFILFKQITACNRRGKFKEAFQFLEKYNALFPNVKDKFIFEMLGLYLEAALKRARGDFKGLKKRLTKALAMADEIEPGLVTATVYIFAATVSDLINLESPVVLTARALEHLECVQDFSDVLAAMRRKANIILAASHLGCNVKGELLKDSIDLLGLEKAKSCIKAISESACEEHPLSVYFDIQLNLVLSIFKYRHSQLYPDQKNRDLDDARSYTKKAQSLAEKYEFVEMTEWSKNNETLCLQELDRAETHTHNHGDEDRPHRNSTPRDVTQNAESQDRSAKSQNSDDLNVKENLQAKAVNREALPGPPMVPPTPTTLQELKADGGTFKEKQLNPQPRLKAVHQAQARRVFNPVGAAQPQMAQYQFQPLPRPQQPVQPPQQQQQQMFRSQQHQQMLSGVQQFFAEEMEHQRKQKQATQKREPVAATTSSSGGDTTPTSQQTTQKQQPKQETKQETKPMKSTKDEQQKKRRPQMPDNRRGGVRTAQIPPQRSQNRLQNRPKPSGPKPEPPVQHLSGVPAPKSEPKKVQPRLDTKAEQQVEVSSASLVT